MDRAAKEGQNLNKRLNSAFGSIKKVMSTVGVLAGVAVGGGLATLGKRAIDSADNIEKLGRRTGATAEFLSEMRFALSQNAVSQGEFETALRKINKSSQDAADGLSTQVRAFEKLGLGVSEFQNLNTDQKFIAISEAISRVEDPAVRTQVAMDIMGRSGAQLLTVMENGATGIKNYRDQSVALGQSLSQDQVQAAAAANDALDKLGKSISGSFSQAILQSSGSIERFANWMGDNLPVIINGVIVVLEGLGAVISTVFSAFGSFVDAVSGSTKALIDHGAVIDDLNGKTGEQLQAQQKSIEARISEIQQDESLRNARGRLSQAAQTEISILQQKLPLVQSSLSQTRVGIQLAVEEAAAKIKVAQADYEEARAKAESIRIGHSGRAARLQAKRALEDLEVAQQSLSQQQQELIKFDERLAQSNAAVSASLAISSGRTITAATTKKELAKQAKEASEQLKELEAWGRAWADSIPITPTQRMSDALNELRRETREASRAEFEIQQALESGEITKKEAIALAQKLGVEYQSTATKTTETVSVMREQWERFRDGAFNSLTSFFRDGLDGAGSFSDSLKDLFKDLVSNILAQITSLIASNAFNSLLSFVSGGSLGSSGGLFDGIGSIFGGGSSVTDAATSGVGILDTVSKGIGI